MPYYEAYVLTEDDHISAPPHIIACGTDQEAIQRSTKLVNGHDIELWEGPRLVTRLKSGTND
jgi:hypothetical protein